MREDAVAAFAAELRPGMRVAVGDGAGSPTHLLPALGAAAREVGGVSLVLGWCVSLPVDFDPSDFHEVRCLMGGFALRRLISSGAAHYVPERLTGIPALLHGPLRPDLALLSLRPGTSDWEWGSEVSWMRSVLDLPDVGLLVEENEALPRASREAPVPRSRGTVVARSRRTPDAVGPPAVDEIDRSIAARLAPFVPAGATLQYGPGPVAEALADALEVPVAIRSGMVTDAVLRLAERGFLTGTPTGAYLWGTQRLYDWADGRPVLDRVERTHAADALSGPMITVNAALEVEHTGAVNVERSGDRLVSGIGGHHDFALAGHVSLGGLSVIAVPTSRNGRSTLVERLSGPTSTLRTDVDLVVTELGVADLRGLDDAERRTALRAAWPS